MNRRQFLSLSTLALAPRAGAASPIRKLSLGVGRQALVGSGHPATAVWAYNGTVPGPELRFKQGERLRIEVENALPVETTVHWHGLRLPNKMDGVPHVTQPPIAAQGGRFVYEFDLPDAGTYWYHPHSHGQEQVARGLYGSFVVEEREPIRVDREVMCVLSDWRLTAEAQVRDDFASGFDLTHAGRIGNTVTVDGRFFPEGKELVVVSGERLRLRLVNTAVARIFALRFDRHEPQVVALDGQAVAPHVPPDGVIVLGPGMRADLVLDCMLSPGARAGVSDSFFRGPSQPLLVLSYSTAAPVRNAPPDWNMALQPNALAEPDLKRAVRHDIVLQGGAMGRLREAQYEGERRPLAELFRAHQVAWAINGVAAAHHVPVPLVALERGASCVLAVENDTQWHHPLHLHGLVFRVLSRNGQPTVHREWRDTMLLAPREKAELAFVADNPGDWMLHCHILAHQAGGMMTMVRVG
jgi:FtsP/CotA-like multicopper oxidase with cupredoxin domain